MDVDRFGAKEFTEDFSRALAALNLVAEKYNLPRPTLALPPEWRGPIKSVRFDPLTSGIALNGVKIRIGQFENPGRVQYFRES